MTGRKENAASVVRGVVQASSAESKPARARVAGWLSVPAITLLAWASAAGAIPSVERPVGGDVGVHAGFSASIEPAVEGKTASNTHRSKGVLDGSDIANRGIVVVAAGAIHNDTDADGLLDAGEGIDYHYTVLNVGRFNLSALALTDALGAVSCPQTALAPGAHMICTRAYVVTAADQTAGAVGNQVQVTGLDAASGPVQAVDVVLTQNLGGRAGIGVFKSPDVLQDADASNTVTAGDVLRYTFVVKNRNAELLGSISLTEPDPTRIDTPIVCSPLSVAGLPFGANGSGVLSASDVVTCTADYTVRSADVTSGDVDNLVLVSALAPVAGQVEGTGFSLVVIPAVQVSLAKTLTGGGPIADPGELLTYTLTFTATSSAGRSFAIGSVTETVPANTVHVAGDGFTCTAASAGSTCTNTNAVIVPGAGSVALTFTVRVLDPVAAGASSIVNVVQPPTGASCDATAGCNETTPLRNQADLAVLKTGPAQVERGQQVTFTIRVENRGPDAAINARLLDPTPAGLVFVSTTGACTGAFPCTLGNMASGEVRMLTATYLVPANYTGPSMIVNVVTAVSDSADPTPGDSSSSSSVLVPQGQPNLFTPQIVPADARWALLLLTALMLLVAWRGLPTR